jgi:hypothetical protein
VEVDRNDPWNKAEDQLYEHACDEDNYDMVLLLAGARARDKAAEEAAKRNPGELR